MNEITREMRTYREPFEALTQFEYEEQQAVHRELAEDAFEGLMANLDDAPEVLFADDDLPF
jgi:hypothetical protein